MDNKLGTVGQHLTPPPQDAPSIDAEDSKRLEVLRAAQEKVGEGDFASWGARTLMQDKTNPPPLPSSSSPKQKVPTFGDFSSEKKQNIDGDIKKQLAKKEEKAKIALIKETYPPEAIAIAQEFHETVSEVILRKGNRFIFTFSQEKTQIQGLFYTFRSLSCGEDYSLRSLARQESWDRSATDFSYDLITYEQILIALIDYAGHDLRELSPPEKRAFLDDFDITIKRLIYRDWTNFQMAIEIIGQGDGFFDLVKKSLALPPPSQSSPTK